MIKETNNNKGDKYTIVKETINNGDKRQER